jgi:hypothetical protein
MMPIDNGEPCWNTTSMDNRHVASGEPLETGHVNQRRPAGNGEPKIMPFTRPYEGDGSMITHTPGRGFKADRAAKMALGEVYDAVPKSAWALIAFYLAEICREDDTGDAGIFARLLEEADALTTNQIMPEAHSKAMRAAIAKARGEA